MLVLIGWHKTRSLFNPDHIFVVKAAKMVVDMGIIVQNRGSITFNSYKKQVCSFGYEIQNARIQFK